MNDKNKVSKLTGRFGCIQVRNDNLSKSEFYIAAQRLGRLYPLNHSADGNSVFIHGISMEKEQFSVDSGRMTTEVNSYRLAIVHYLGEYAAGVTIVTHKTGG